MRGSPRVKGWTGFPWLVLSLLLGPLETLLIVLLPMPGVAARPLGRTELAVIGVVLAILVVVVAGLMASGAAAMPRIGG